MEEPAPELTATADERAERPDFDALTPPDNLVRGERTRDDFFDAVLGLDSPTTAGEVADRAGHGVDAAREYLEWFERMGIVKRVTDSPATYERNQAYLNWRRVQSLRDGYTSDELVGLLEAETRRARELADRFGVDSPDEVSVSDRAVASGRSVEAVWEDVSDWRTARRRIALLERALAADPDDAVGEHPVA